MKHIEHVEDLLFNEENGALKTLDILYAVNEWTTQSYSQPITVNKKHDGIAVVFGVDPKTNLFFVSTKSAWNKEPKLAFDYDDIDKFWGKTPELCEKLKYCRKYLPFIYPWYPGNIYQADLLYTDKSRNGENLSFSPNTLIYQPRMCLYTLSDIRKSKLGICIHTKYSGTSFSSLRPSLINKDDIDSFNVHKDVFLLSPVLTPSSLSYAIDAVQREEFDSIVELVKTSILSSFRSNELKSAMNQYIWNGLPYEGTEVLFWYYRTVQNIKHRIMNRIKRITHDKFYYYVGKKDCLHETDCEGYVVQYNDTIVKLVNRQEFSRLNQKYSKFREEKTVA